MPVEMRTLIATGGSSPVPGFPRVPIPSVLARGKQVLRVLRRAGYVYALVGSAITIYKIVRDPGATTGEKVTQITYHVSTYQFPIAYVASFFFDEADVLKLHRRITGRVPSNANPVQQLPPLIEAYVDPPIPTKSLIRGPNRRR